MKTRNLPIVIPAVVLGVCISNAQYSTMNYEVKLYPDKAERVAFPFENPGYARLFLTPAKNTGYNQIKSSRIDLPGDDCLWHRINASGSSHQYAIDSLTGPGYSGREHVVIKGELGNSSTGGGGKPPINPWFRVTVPDVNINWEGQTDETKEDTYVQFCPLTPDKSHHQIVTLRVPRDDYSLTKSTVVTVKWDWDNAIRLVWAHDNVPFPNGGTIDFSTHTGPYRFRVEPLAETYQAFKITVTGQMDDKDDRNHRERTPMDKVLGAVFNPKLISIKFNHNTGSSANDAINLRQDYNTPYDVSSGEWQFDPNTGTVTQNYPACYAANRSVAVKTKLEIKNYLGLITDMDILAVQVGKEASLGDIARTNITVAAGLGGDYMFNVVGQTPSAVGLARSNEWAWVVTHVNGNELKKPFPFCTSGVHRVYTILDEPKTPWDNTSGNQKNAWVTALDIACSNSWAGGASSVEDAAGRITTAIYNSGRFEYDSANGACFYTSSDFDLTSWIARINGGFGNGNLVNCWDCANGVVSLSNILGCDLWNQWVGEGFYCNEISAIKDLPFGKPFWGGFGYHRMGWRGPENDTGRVFDACLKVTGGTIPRNILFGTGVSGNGYKFLLVDPVSYGSCSPSASPSDMIQYPRQRRDTIK